MKNTALFSAGALLLALTVSNADAQTHSALLEQRLKASYNTMVRDVRETQDPAAKREIIGSFIGRLDKGLGLVETLLPASHEASLAAVKMRGTLAERLDELNGMATTGPSAGSNLNAFAAFLQQDVEQADGIYLSVGALIIILLVLILVL